jgi:hypothetical protein
MLTRRSVTVGLGAAAVAVATGTIPAVSAMPGLMVRDGLAWREPNGAGRLVLA